ncbi:hypothetical protein BCR43DRAFT_509466 [Syncephalastrum racemosum]|uniref:C2H2-type domain-containing protein n=1 Tax=Syncephalastrum racemosum TaxID=13706 RepID=A0A1X2HRX0_SYNRA|nr:hypothetical protein BCR43DRAFT_509466 [Syncephalastrum racemosum]
MHDCDYNLTSIYWGFCYQTLKRFNDFFYCPICDKELRTTKATLLHIRRHNYLASCGKPEDDDNRYEPEEEEELSENCATSARLLSSNISSNKTPAAMSTREVILDATGALTAGVQEQEDKLMLVKRLRATPLVFSDGDRKYSVLVSPQNAERLLQTGNVVGSVLRANEDNDDRVVAGRSAD